MNDLKFALRQLLKNPGFTAVVVVTLALGIGANTAIFSVVNAVLLRSLPYPEPDRLVAVCEGNPGQGWDQYVTSMGAYADWRRQSTVFEDMAAATVLGPAAVSGGNEAELVHVGAVSADFFPLLGIQPILGRGFISEEESPEHGNVVLLSERLWRERYGADPAVLNQTIQLGDRAVTVVGIMPSSVRLFDPSGVLGWDSGFAKSALWRPLPVNSGLRNQRNYRAFLVLGRLKTNVTLARAQAGMNVIAREQASDFPDSNAGWSITVQPWQRTVVRNARLPLIVLLASVGLVLLIATANIANLYLARTAARRKEFAIRRALGAGQGHLARQFLVESLLMSAFGGTAGVLLAHWSVHLLIGLLPADFPRLDEIGIDGHVLVFTFIISLVAGVLFGLAPFLTSRQGDINCALKQESGGSTGRPSSGRWRSALVTAQVALAMVLLTGAGLLVRTFQRLYEVDPGFHPDNLVAVDVSIAGRSFTNEFRRIDIVDRLLTRLSDVVAPGSLSAVDGLPLDAGHNSMEIALTGIEGLPPAAPEIKRTAGFRLVGPDYFTTMGIVLSRGRLFTRFDNTNGLPVVIVNEAFARQYFSGGDPLGRQIESPDFGSKPCEIVGVIQDVRQTSLDAAVRPEVFRPLLQECFSGITIVARSDRASAEIFDAVRKEAGALDQNLPVYNPRTLNELLSNSLAPRRLALSLLGLFAGLALLLALVGVAGVLTCLVNERVREIGIRLALGAQRREVVLLVVAGGMRSVAAGALIGIAGACVLARFLGSLLYEISPNDPLTLASVALMIAVTASVACWLPARRAANVDPMTALRTD